MFPSFSFLLSPSLPLFHWLAESGSKQGPRTLLGRPPSCVPPDPGQPLPSWLCRASRRTSKASCALVVSINVPFPPPPLFFLQTVKCLKIRSCLVYLKRPSERPCSRTTFQPNLQPPGRTARNDDNVLASSAGATSARAGGAGFRRTFRGNARRNFRRASFSWRRVSTAVARVSPCV